MKLKLQHVPRGKKLRGPYLTRYTKKWQSGLERQTCSSWLDRKWFPSESLGVRAFPDIHENVRAPMGVFSLRNEGGKTEWTNTHSTQRREGLRAGGRTRDLRVGLSWSVREEDWSSFSEELIHLPTAFQTAFHSGAGANGVGEMSDLK